MFFKKPAQKLADSQGNPFVSSLADTYLKFSLDNLGEEKVREVLKGKFASLRYTLSGFDPSELPYKDKVKLISVLYDYSIEAVGPIEAKGTLEELGLKVKDRLGVDKAFQEGLQDLPEGVFSVYRLKTLSREELEETAKKCLIQIEETRAGSTRSVAEKTMKLEAERDILESILYNASDGVFALDRSGKIITFNKKMEDLTGYIFDEVEHRPADDYIRLFDVSVPLEVSTYSSTSAEVSGSEGFSKDKLTLVGRNGGKKYVSMRSSSIREGREVNIGCIATLIDITKDIDLEMMKLDFVSIAAHELRTPLTAMRGYLSLLGEDLKDKLDPNDTDYLEKSILSADRLHGLIENLLNISRIERGALVIQKTKQNWIDIVKSEMAEIEAEAQAANLTLELIEPKTAMPEINVDKTTIVEVLSNLLDNSVRYTKPGGKITVSVEVSGDKVITHIEDTGIGIPQASIPHIFKKFYRVSTTVLRAGEKGTGLGLFISKEIVKMHGGEIWVKSEEGKGSIFSFSLPI
ncbi:hypothetical protein A2886_01075 [candidate division WWE3 bacterium RIFCSPHIGHO2_01_FULL_42_13]|uniref:histidine kinase n=1 Tax=candidate division WWE3 bacterium RIFCSPHIGHO2_01_FULL_42_13 TaxID=1802617 RepID=A0A1F4USR8_UNCKA|nr:MAG: hypothetical protein A2886_01075 [candidate division WWE3 bacterium RIFCSPHIGHO2_01_FULL_42_13]